MVKVHTSPISGRAGALAQHIADPAFWDGQSENLKGLNVLWMVNSGLWHLAHGQVGHIPENWIANGSES